MTEPAFTAVLDGRDVDVRLGAAYSSVTYDLNIESTAALTVVVHDQARKMKASGILDLNEDGRLDASVQITADGVIYRLAGCRKDGDTFTLTFEDRAVSRLRSARGQLKPRAGENHVRFARRLCELVNVPFITPTGIGVATDATPLEHKRLRAEADARHEKGLPDNTPSGLAVDELRAGARRRPVITVKGVRATAEQLRNMEVVLGVAAEVKAGPKATLAVVLGCIVESTFRNPTVATDADSIGILQLRVSQHGLAKARSIRQSVLGFLNDGYAVNQGAIELAKLHADWTAGMIAAEVQGPRKDLRGEYDKWSDEGHRIVAAYGGDTVTQAAAGTVLAGLTTGPRPSRQASQIQRGTPENPTEDSWAALKRFAPAKGYRVFALRGEVHYARDQDLIDSRPRATISEQSPGVDWINWEHEPRKKVNTASVRCVASLWAAPPGSVVIIRGEGAADGRWLVSSFQRDRDSLVAAISLRRGTALLQPQKTVESPQGPGAVSQAGTGSVEAICQTISDQGRVYLYGGGHGKPLKDITPKEPLDCSSSSSLALFQAGLFAGPTAQVSGWYATQFGEAGKGKEFSVYAHDGHMFLQGEGEHNWRFDTGGPGGGEGPRLRRERRPTTGFTVRRVKGSG